MILKQLLASSPGHWRFEYVLHKMVGAPPFSRPRSFIAIQYCYLEIEAFSNGQEHWNPKSWKTYSSQSGLALNQSCTPASLQFFDFLWLLFASSPKVSLCSERKFACYQLIEACFRAITKSCFGFNSKLFSF